MHFAAAGFYLLAARLAFRTDERGHRLGASIPDATLAAATTLWVPLLYAGALTLALGCWYLVEDVAGQAGASRSEVLWTFVALSLAVGAVGASMRFWWPAARGHTYLIAIGVSLFALVYAAELDGPVTEALVAFTATALALVLWEREPRALPVPAAYGLVLVLAAWRHFNPDDAYLPLALTGLAVLLFLASLAFRRLGGGWHLQLLLIAFAYAAIAPFAGWIALAQLADPGGFVGNEHFEKTSLYLTSALSVVALGLLMSSYALLVRSLEAGRSASAVLMLAALLGIGRYSPENVQFYTAPLGAYLFVLGAVTTRLHALTDEWRAMLQPLVTLGPSVIMAPTFLQSLDADAWEYGVVLLAESLAFIGIAVVQRWSGLLAVSIGFLVLDGAHYLFFADGGEGATLPTWAILTMAGILVMLAGTAILFSRDRWSAWQRALRVWWYQDPRAG